MITLYSNLSRANLKMFNGNAVQQEKTSQTLNPLSNEPLVENPPELDLEISDDVDAKSSFPLEIVQSHDVPSKSRYQDLHNLGESDD